MGYILALGVMVILLVFAMGFMMRSGKPSGRVKGDRAILREEPSADAPTPGNSNTASRAEAATAQKHTPPA